ncbi:hypothetical protein LY78DRAFT_358310 [Colletotrichum sublineola]|uniref:Uncharacterized protein n=1 Tax=Colletotrichum sublineola TaxID=1173701 RepID=A0A066XE21_COLSU|nr:hypothetical protein LY78DRAFT_358310 [Colletotrichum sublineola]KDN64006.1 hypothetical protein CSUB01_02569 [Colletotrichum sublineola]
MASYTDLRGTASSGKLSKTRGKPVVKPILKKLSHSEKNSLDLDRGWDEQQTTFGHYGGSLGREREGSFGGRDVSFSISATELHHSSSIGNGRSKFSHARSTSGTSHVSVATSGSGHRNGSFVHPFQQTPRTSTPPLSYANSLASIDQGGSSSNNNIIINTNPGTTGPRDYSPTITEDDDDDLLDQHYLHHRSNYHAAVSSSIPITGNPSSSSYPRRPSLASRTSSLSDINNHTGPPSLRINTSRTNSNATSSRLAHVSSHSDINQSGRISDTTVPNTAPVLSPLSSASPSTSGTAMSPLRTSLEGFRLRSRSDLDSNYHQERIRLERHRWEEKERLKNEKRDKEEMRKRERADIKEALRHEREQQQMMKREAKEAARKQSFSHSARNSSSDIIRPSISRKKTAPDAEKLAMGAAESGGGVGFASRNYESTDQGQAPVADDAMFEGPRRSLTAKRKTQGAWTSFVLWFRTRILRLHDNMAKK